MFDLTKPVQLKNGQKARIICENCTGPLGNTIVAEITSEDRTFLRWCNESDLVNVPEHHEGWINISKDSSTTFGASGVIHPTKALANTVAPYNRTACIKIAWTEEEGLD